ncbi:ZIP family metal transporter [Patescibacteria group bacterium]
MTFILIITASLIISLISLLGSIAFVIKKDKLNRILLLLVSLSAGTMLGGAFFHLIPEATETLDIKTVSTLILISFILFFIIEKFLHWRHCHKDNCKVHTFGYMNLVGDSIHNFLDGIIIAAAFLTNTELGIVTTIAIALHEIPQEISDFGVLVHSGFSKKKALLANFIVAITALLGSTVGFFLVPIQEELISYMIPFAAGSFLYIAASDLLPEIRKEKDMKKYWLNFLLFLIGVVIMYLLAYT